MCYKITYLTAYGENLGHVLDTRPMIHIRSEMLTNDRIEIQPGIFRHLFDNSIIYVQPEFINMPEQQ